MIGGTWPGYWIFAGLLVILQCLHVFWFYLIVRMVVGLVSMRDPNISSFLYSFIYPFYTHVYTPLKLLLYSSYTHVYTHVYTPFILLLYSFCTHFYTPVCILDRSLSHLSLTDSFCFSFFLILVPFTPYSPSVGKQWRDRKRC